MVPIALLYVKNWEEECCKQKKEEFREQFRESIQTLSAILNVERNLPHLQEKNKNYKGI